MRIARGGKGWRVWKGGARLVRDTRVRGSLFASLASLASFACLASLLGLHF